MYYLNHYVVDWEKVRTFEDLKRIVQAFEPTFEPDFKGVEAIRDLVRLESKPPVRFVPLSARTDSDVR